MAARDLNAEVQYLKATDRYGITIDLNDLRTKMDKQPEAQSKLHLEGGAWDATSAQLKTLEFDSGKASVLHATATLNHFAQPEWQIAANGTLELRQIIGADGDGWADRRDGGAGVEWA